MKIYKRKPRIDQSRPEFIRASIASGHSLQKIGDALGITRERVRQIANEWGITQRAGLTLEGRKKLSQAVKEKWQDPEYRLIYSRHFVHSQDIINQVVALKWKSSASEISKQFGFPSRNVVIGIWNRARKNAQSHHDD